MTPFVPGDRPDFQEISYLKEAGVATVTFRRPEAHNAYTTHTLAELVEAFKVASWDDSVGVIVLTGTGTRAFCTGGDVREYQSTYTKRPHDYWKYMNLFRGYIEGILDCGKPVIARLNGMAVGGGNESHLACDLSVIAEHAWVGQVGVGVGSVACGGATQWLPLFVGDRRARQMLLLNERIPAKQALEWGLVTKVVPSVRRGDAWVEGPTTEQIDLAQKAQGGYRIDLSLLDAAVADLARQLLDKFPECARYTKEQTNFWKSLSWHQTVGHAREWLALHFANVEPYEGMTAFAEKRKPRVREMRESAAQGGAPEFLWGPYGRACGACGAKGLPESFKFCGVCGASLGGPVAGGGKA